MSLICQCRAFFSIPYIGNVLYWVLLNIFWSQMSFICQRRAFFSIPYIGNVLYRVLLNIFWSQMSFICWRRAFFSIPYVGYVPYRVLYAKDFLCIHMVHGSTGTISFVYKGVADGNIYSLLLQPASAIGYLLCLLVQKYPMSLTGITTEGCWDCASHHIF